MPAQTHRQPSIWATRDPGSTGLTARWIPHHDGIKTLPPGRHGTPGSTAPAAADRGSAAGGRIASIGSAAPG
ncbi:hypothetical protein MSM1_03730 [Mycobacterium sp. SM1]|uniref:hypothetical protein n=1 Tax=Mycobacterium sp. SM1 TaxID=2816243 RepID=UPI001BD111A3|nr:hypothetical protein [Mycobacterium sp. SM1]MBS4727502.1 hypothetical protein [Mycobacterium sp. SM1]